MSKIQCLNCGGMTEVGDALSGTCEYCSCRVEFKRVSSFNGINRKTDLGNIRKLFEASKEKKSEKDKAIPEEKSDLALALCYLLAGNYILAKKKLASLIGNDPAEPEPYYYYALTLINGRSLSEISMKEAREITGYLQTAIAMDENFVFPKLLYALLCVEYYEYNCLRSPDDGNTLLEQLFETEVDPAELDFFKSLVNTQTV